MSETISPISPEPQLTKASIRETEYSSQNFSPWFIEARSQHFRKDHAQYLTIARTQAQTWSQELDHYKNLQQNQPEEYKKLFDDNEEVLSPEELVLEGIKDNLAFVRNQHYSKKDLASPEVLPDVLGHLSAAVKIVFGYELRSNQMEAVIAGITGNKKVKAQNALKRQLDRTKDLAHLSPFSPELYNDPEGKGNIAEVPTGEGKTLVEALTAIIFTLEGRDKGVFISSTNDYLASEGLQQMGKLYEALGMVASYLAPQDPEKFGQDQFIYSSTANGYHNLSLLPLPDRQTAYRCDVVYGSLEEFGFDYNRDVTEILQPLRQIKGLGVIIADEIHEAVPDATSPLINTKPYVHLDQQAQTQEIYEPDVEIEGKVYSPSQLHKVFSDIVKLLDDNDFELDRTTKSFELYDPSAEAARDRAKKKTLEREAPTTVYARDVEERLHNEGLLPENESLETTSKFTEKQKVHLYQAYLLLGTEKLTKLMKAFGLIDEAESDFYQSPDADILLYYLRPALNARSNFSREGFDFTKTGDSGVNLLDPVHGRSLEGRELAEGGHQAIEARLNRPITAESQTIASITYPEFLALFDQVAGFTANALEYAEEMSDLYHLDVIQIPPHIPSQRIDDRTEVIYATQEEKFEAIFEQEIVPILIADVKQPILIGLHGQEAVINFYQFLKRKIADYNDTHPDTPLLPTKLQFVTEINKETAHEKFSHAGEEGVITISDRAGIGVDPMLGGARPSGWNAQQDAAATEKALKSITLGGHKPEETEFEGREVAYKEALAQWEATHQRINDAGGLRAIGEHGDYVSDAQFRGRSGRNGDKGSTRFYSSQDDYFYVQGMGEGRDKLEYHGRPAQKLIKFAQKTLVLRDKLARESLMKTHVPLQDYRKRFVERRQEIYLGLERDRQKVQPDNPVGLYDSEVGRLATNYAGRMIADIVTDYEETLKALPPDEEVKQATEILTQTIDMYCETFGIDGEDRQHLLDQIAEAAPDYILEKEQILSSETLWATLTHFATTYYQLQLQKLAENIRQQFTPHFPEEELNAAVQRGVITKQAEMVLTLMDETWQDYYEERIKRNAHIWSTERDPKTVIQQQTAESFNESFGNNLMGHITTALFTHISTSLSS